MMKRIATALVAAAVGASVLTVAAPALADPAPDAPVSIESVKVTPDPVVIRGSDDVTVTATVQTVNAADVKIGFGPTGQGGAPDCNPCAGAAKASAGGAEWKTWTRSIVLDRRDPDGKWVVYVEATGRDGKVVKAESSFQVRHVRVHKPYRGPRATRIEGFDASPEPVRKGRKLTLEGRLTAASCRGNWWWNGDVYVVGDGRCRDDHRWSGWRQVGWQDIKVYFHPASGGRWQYVDTIGTNPDGTFFTKIPAYWSGTWKVVFEGARGLYGSSAADYVRVVG
ncbi:hypothetical protein Skr01_60520 [Sphaerisporangium krabiense]|uniref:Uncharacterized protein n=1 Tax=Sphaerisporangium krabiense TaxID=763782 RepID=A0A7W8ZBS1_9ACTN|nr:hypothetical protein [Sphaerisporangium krabiense]MBB5631082.1 hypothetical protein [Sphaerisporangium krabiense]GII65967.1 hypothetical protein Skr01_60520 [Sphaerisporangium krabiense]